MQIINRKCLECGDWSRNTNYSEGCGAIINVERIAERQAALQPSKNRLGLIQFELVDWGLNYFKKC